MVTRRGEQDTYRPDAIGQQAISSGIMIIENNSKSELPIEPSRN
jgi:hypothetical protein